VLNSSPLFTGGAGSWEGEIRRYVLENDLVEAIIGLPIKHRHLDLCLDRVEPQARASQGQGGPSLVRARSRPLDRSDAT
jgi:hypothetical protein